MYIIYIIYNIVKRGSEMVFWGKIAQIISQKSPRYHPVITL